MLRSKLIFIFLFLFSSFASASLDELHHWIDNNHLKDNSSISLSPEITHSLLRDVKEKKFVFLGEPDHYFHEKYIYRLAFIKELLSLGFYNIYAELGVFDGMRVNQYLETGDEKYLKQVGLYGFKYGEPLVYREDAFVDEVVRYFKELRKLKRLYPKLKYGGFDLDMYPGTGYLDFDQFSKREDVINFANKNNKFLNSINLIKKAQQETELALIELNLAVGLSQAIESRDEGVEFIKDYDQFLFFYKIFKDSFTFKREIQIIPLNWGVFAWREERMFEIMSNILSHHNEKDKYILLGHNGHLLKSDALNREGKRYTDWDTIGAWITKKFPNDVFAIWSLIGQGEHRGHGCPGRTTCSIELIPGTLENDLYSISSDNPIYFKNSSVLKKVENEIKTIVNGVSVTSGKYGDYADAFYFLPNVTDLQKED